MQFQKVSHLFSKIGYSPIQPLASSIFSDARINIDVKRDDLLHPIISGNKWRKLKHLLMTIEQKGYRSVASMGGRYSNHLHTLSYIGHLLGWNIELYILGYPEQPVTPMMQDAIRWGAKIKHVDRKAFQKMRVLSPVDSEKQFWIPEGGYDKQALYGTAESLMEVNAPYDYLVTACATGTTLAGYALAKKKLKLSTTILGVAVLKNDDEIEKHLKALTGDNSSAEIIRGFECGGYAKVSDELLEFMETAEKQFQLPLEPIYSGKALWALTELSKRGYFPQGSRILFIHCGGLQGKRTPL